MLKNNSDYDTANEEDGTTSIVGGAAQASREGMSSSLCFLKKITLIPLLDYPSELATQTECSKDLNFYTCTYQILELSKWGTHIIFPL